MNPLSHTLRSLSAIAVLAAGLSSTASAAVISAFDFQANPTGVWFQDPQVTTSFFTRNGGLTYFGNASNRNVVGWSVSPSINVNSGQSVTFDITVAEGYQMNLTDFTFSTFILGQVGAPTSLTIGAWGYKADGADWVLHQFTLTSTNTFQTWTFDETVVVQDSIQFGFFAAGATQAGGAVTLTGNRTGDDMIVGGTVTAVPEPSTYALFGLGAIALWAFKRRQNSGVVTTA